MTIVRRTEGDAYYGNGEAACYTCWSAGKILLSIGGGQFYKDILEEAEIELLRQAASKHEIDNPSHNVRIDVFQRGVGESRQWQE